MGCELKLWWKIYFPFFILQNKNNDAYHSCENIFVKKYLEKIEYCCIYIPNIF